MQRTWVALLLVTIFTFAGATAAFCEVQASNFGSSLHKTGAGQKYWYDAKDGLKQITGIPYSKLDCGNCHVKACKTCHTKSIKAADTRDVNTCLNCHRNQKTAIAMDKAAGMTDVHAESGLICNDCHVTDKGDDFHGDAAAHNSLYDKGAVKAKCTNCHEADQNVRAHKVHGNKIACIACHAKSSVAFVNNHFDSYLAGGKREGNMIPAKSWTVLMNNADGQVTAAAAQSFIYKNKKLVVYYPSFSHSISREAKKCEDCHANEAVKLIKTGKTVPMIKKQGEKMVNWEGIAPLMPGALYWEFFNKSGDKWVAAPAGPFSVQYVGYGKPLTQKQLAYLKAPFKD